MEPGRVGRGRVAVVTGARQGLGRVVAQHLAGQGYALALLDVGASAATEESVRAQGVPVLSVEVDVADEAGVRAATDRVLDRFGQVDVLVNNAGISLIAPAEATPVEQWRRVLEVNLTGPFLLCQTFGRGMLDRRLGSIVNIASIAGLRGIADRAAYNASKHGLVGLTRTLAVEWGGRGVRVNAVCPGWIKTEMDVADQDTGAYTDDDIVDHVPMGRFARPEDIAQAVAFLADGNHERVHQRSGTRRRRRLARRRQLAATPAGEAVATGGQPGRNSRPAHYPACAAPAGQRPRSSLISRLPPGSIHTERPLTRSGSRAAGVA